MPVKTRKAQTWLPQIETCGLGHYQVHRISNTQQKTHCFDTVGFLGSNRQLTCVSIKLKTVLNANCEHVVLGVQFACNLRVVIFVATVQSRTLR